MTSSSLEIFVGIICSCSLAFPAFLDRHFPQGLGLFVSKIAYYFSSRREDKSALKHSTSRVHLSESSPNTRPTSTERKNDGYRQLHEKIKMADLRGDMAHRSADCSNKTTVQGGRGNGDAEALASGGIMKTVAVQQSYPEAAYSTKPRP